MTEFEEDLKKKLDSEQVPMYITQSGCSMTRKTYIETDWIFDTYKNWRSDEHVQKLVELGGSYVLGNYNLIEDNKRLAQEIVDLKAQLEHQPLPVVPEYVSIWIKKCQELNWMITDVLAPESWSSDFAKDTENWLKESKENFNLLALAFITGKYQVEKPQLFYLKNKLTNEYLAREDFKGYYCHVSNNNMSNPYTKEFTQKEIDSMGNIDSYEKMEVEE